MPAEAAQRVVLVHGGIGTLLARLRTELHHAATGALSTVFAIRAPTGWRSTAGGSEQLDTKPAEGRATRSFKVSRLGGLDLDKSARYVFSPPQAATRRVQQR